MFLRISESVVPAPTVVYFADQLEQEQILP